jgi:anthranilate phosphoribosyltransferase
MTHDAGRVTTAEIFAEMGVQECIDAHAVAEKFLQQQPAFMVIQNLAPQLYQLLQVRRVLGLRNSTHMLVKIMQPFTGKALRLVSYTHPEYFTLLCDYFSTASNPAQGDVFLMRGTEGETVANAKRANAIEWFHEHQRSTLVERQEPVDHFPDLPANDAATTATWIKQALADEQLIPFAIKEQVEHCKQIARQLRT